jgi:calcium-dependent secretion activator
VSQYCFATCSYREKKSEPTEMMPLDGYTVDYAEPDNGNTSMHCRDKQCDSIDRFLSLGLVMHDAKYFFKAVREGDVVTFATNEENERHSWVQALYRATGQSHKPTPPTSSTAKSAQGTSTSGQKDQAGKSNTMGTLM